MTKMEGRKNILHPSEKFHWVWLGLPHAWTIKTLDIWTTTFEPNHKLGFLGLRHHITNLLGLWYPIFCHGHYNNISMWVKMALHLLCHSHVAHTSHHWGQGRCDTQWREWHRHPAACKKKTSSENDSIPQSYHIPHFDGTPKRIDPVPNQGCISPYGDGNKIIQ